MKIELWGKEIIKARFYISQKKYFDAKEILLKLLKNDSKACVLDAKKLLVEISLLEKSDLQSSMAYCRDILNERYDIKYLKYLIELGYLTTTLSDSIVFIMNLKKNLSNADNVTINLQLIHVLVSINKNVDDLILKLLDEAISNYKDLGILDDHFLCMRKFPSFSVFIDLLKDIQKIVSSFDLESYVTKNLNWIDETGKQILTEKGLL